MVATAKNQKERIVEMAKVLGDALQVGASVQSTDPDVLRRIKRTNISLETIVKMAKGATDSRTGSFTEIILALPGDTKDKHMKSAFDMLDAGIQDLRLFQFILLPGTEGADAASRALYQYETGFRVLARCFGRYEIHLAKDVPVAEIQEVCLGNNTMPREDYLACRTFDLTIAIFNNGGVLKEFFRLAEALGVTRSTVLHRISRSAGAASGPLAPWTKVFMEAERRNFFATPPGAGGLPHAPWRRSTPISAATTESTTSTRRGRRHSRRCSRCWRGWPARLVTAEFRQRGILDEVLTQYLDELLDVAVARKSQLTDLSRSTELLLHFAFPCCSARTT